MPDATCHRCGTCCRKGGPCLHDEDMPLFAEGILALTDVLTLRAGEIVRELDGSLVPLATERVKIAARVLAVHANPDSPAFARSARPIDWTCRFFQDNACGLYAQRPLQCRLLFCEAPEALEARYAVDCANRAQVLAATDCPGVWQELAQAHEEACPHSLLAKYAKAMQTDKNVRELFEERVRYDDAFRALCQQKAGVPVDMLPFLLGRPVRSLEHFTLEIVV